MSDICGQADKMTEAYTKAAIKESRKTRFKLYPNGICHNPRCEDETTHPSALFCDSTCAKVYDRIKELGL